MADKKYALYQSFAYIDVNKEGIVIYIDYDILKKAGLTKEQLHQEEIIKASIENDIPVFLHGKSGDGKTARIHQIAPDCETMTLGNSTLESLVGKEAYKELDGKRVKIQ